MTKPNNTATIPTAQLKPGHRLWISNATLCGFGSVYEVRACKRTGNSYTVAVKANGIAQILTISDSEVEIVN